MSHYIIGCPLPSDFLSVDRRPLLKMASGDRCRIADLALSNIEDTYGDYKAKCDIVRAQGRTVSVRIRSGQSVGDHHRDTGCQHCLGMVAFCMLHNDDPEDTCPDLVQIVCETARKALPSAYGHLVLGLVFWVVAGLRRLPSADKELSLQRTLLHLRHCDHLHIGCLYLGHACCKAGFREEAFKAFVKGSKLGLRVLCLKGSGECYLTGFGVQQDSIKGRSICNEAANEDATLKDMFFKEWEKNVKTGENLEAFFKKLLLTVENNLQPKDHALPVTLADEAIASGETLTGLWL